MSEYNWPDDYDLCSECGGMSYNIRTEVCENKPDACPVPRSGEGT